MLDWLPFQADADDLLGLVAELDAWRPRLDLKAALPRTWQGRLRRDLEAEATAASLRMEGVPVTVEEVRRVLAGDPTVKVAEPDRVLVEGYRDAMAFVTRRADAADFHWDTELIVGLHDRAMGGRYDLGAGRLRDRQVWLMETGGGRQVFLPPPASEVGDWLERLCRDAEGWPDHPALLSAWVHVALAAIHPFLDGNGRAARILASLSMYRGGFKRREFTSLEEWWGRHTHTYYRSFQCLGEHFDPRADVTPFVVTHLQAQVSQVRALDLREEVERRLWVVTEEMVGDLGLAPRVANAVWEAYFGRTVTAGYYASLTDVSRATVTNDLAACVAAGLLRAEGERRGRRYLPGSRLFALLGEPLNLETEGPAEARRDQIVGHLTWLILESRRLPGQPGR